jgi:Hypoxia induced protein conserved region
VHTGFYDPAATSDALLSTGHFVAEQYVLPYVSLMNTVPINIAIFVAMGLVLAVLIAGIVNLSMTSDQARSRSNQLMRLRVLAQFLAVVLLMVGFWVKTRMN